MILNTMRVMIELEHRGVVPVDCSVGTRVDCLRGRLWITEWGATDDVVLDAGESYVISRGGVAVVQALREGLVGFRVFAMRHPQPGLARCIERFWSWWDSRATAARPVVAQPEAAYVG